jgi:signal peptidase I
MAAGTAQSAAGESWQSPTMGWGHFIGDLFGLTFTSPVAYQLVNLSALGFLCFLGFVPLPGFHRCFGFSGFFGLIGVAFIVEMLAGKKGILSTASRIPNPPTDGKPAMGGLSEEPPSATVPLWVFLFLYGGLIYFVVRSAGSLPLRPATHFDIDGKPNGWMNRSSFLVVTSLLPLFFVTLFWLVSRATGRFPHIFNIPRRDYWLAPERRAFAQALILRWLLWLAGMLTVFFGGLHGLILQANRLQQDLRSPHALTLIWVVVFLLALMVWMGGFLTRLAEADHRQPVARGSAGVFLSKHGRRLLRQVLIALPIALAIRTFFLQPFAISGNRAAPEIPAGSEVMVWKLSSSFVPGDVIAYRHGEETYVGRVVLNGPAEVTVNRNGEPNDVIPRDRVIGKVVSVYWRGTQSSPRASAGNAAIGIAMDKKGDRMLIFQIVPHAPASEDGRLHVGDAILKFGDDEQSMVSVAGMTLGDCALAMRGQDGSKITLLVVPAGKSDAEAYVVTLTRRLIPVLEAERLGQLGSPRPVVRAPSQSQDSTSVELEGGIKDQLTQLRVELAKEQADFQAFITKNNMAFWQEQGKSAAVFLSGLKNQQAQLLNELQRLENLSPDELLATSMVAAPKAAGTGSTPSGSGAPFNSELYVQYTQVTQQLIQKQAELEEWKASGKPRHPKLEALQSKVEDLQRWIGVIKQQNAAATQSRVVAIKAELRSLESSIASWEQKLLEASSKDAEYRRLQSAVASTQGQIDKLLGNTRDLDPRSTSPEPVPPGTAKAATPLREILLKRFTFGDPMISSEPATVGDDKGISAWYLTSGGRGFLMSELKDMLKEHGEQDPEVIAQRARIEARARFVSQPRVVRFYEVPNPNVEDCTVLYRAKLKSNDLEGRAYLEMWCRFPGMGEAFSRGLDQTISRITTSSIYGDTAAGVIAAVQAKKMGKSVVLVGPDKHLGGLSSGGLGFTDTGNKAVIGGLSRDFYHRVWQHYDQPPRGRGRKRRNTATKARERRPSMASSARCGSLSRTSRSRSSRIT